MKLKNDSPEFVLQYNAVEFVIPQGEFEVENSDLANHILYVSHKWGKNVSDLNVSSAAIKKVEGPIKKVVAPAALVEDVAKPTEPVAKKPGRPKKDEQQPA